MYYRGEIYGLKSNFGFTLIELLAVITILGILMMIAIPAVSRTIENSRRDAFADLAQSYIDSVRASVLANEFKCCKNNTVDPLGTATCDGEWIDVASTESYIFMYVNINTYDGNEWKPQTEDLMESGGKSPWGNADVIGVAAIYKGLAVRNSSKETKTVYKIKLKDSAGHGIETLANDQHITRKNVTTHVTGWVGNLIYNDQQYICKLS